jgi:hypothetical protein
VYFLFVLSQWWEGESPLAWHKKRHQEANEDKPETKKRKEPDADEPVTKKRAPPVVAAGRDRRNQYTEPELEAEWKKGAIWRAGPTRKLGPLQAMMKKDGGEILFCSLGDIHKIYEKDKGVEDKNKHYVVPARAMDVSAQEWIDQKVALLPGLNRALKVLWTPTDVYIGCEVTPEEDVWWSGYDKKVMVTVLTLRGPVHGPKSGLRTTDEEASAIFLRSWILYSHAWSTEECDIVLDLTKAEIKKFSKDHFADEKHLEQMAIVVRKHRMMLLNGLDIHWGMVTGMPPEPEAMEVD